MSRWRQPLVGPPGRVLGPFLNDLQVARDEDPLPEWQWVCSDETTRSISKDELKEKLNEYVIIDVREPDEIENGIIEYSQNMPLGLAIRNAKKGNIEELKDKKICVYCASGYRGNIAADELTKAGFSAVNLDGGYMELTG